MASPNSDMELQRRDTSASPVEEFEEFLAPYKERGPMECAELPECRDSSVPYDEYKYDREERIWVPPSEDKDEIWYNEYLLNARSALTEAQQEELKLENMKAMENACTDISEQYIWDILHDCDYDAEIARMAIRGRHVPSEIYEEWSELEKELLIEGLRHFGRNFRKIRQIALPTRDTKSLMSYYYSWKWADILEPVKRGNKRVYNKKKHLLKEGESQQSEISRLSRTMTRSLCRSSRNSLKAIAVPMDSDEFENLSIEEKVRRVYANVEYVGSPPRYRKKSSAKIPEDTRSDVSNSEAGISAAKLNGRKTRRSRSKAKAGYRKNKYSINNEARNDSSCHEFSENCENPNANCAELASFAEVNGNFTESGVNSSTPSIAFPASGINSAVPVANSTPKAKPSADKNSIGKQKLQAATIKRRYSQRSSTSVYATRREENSSFNDETSTTSTGSASNLQRNSMPSDTSNAAMLVGDENCDPQQQPHSFSQRGMKRRHSVRSIITRSPEIVNTQNILAAEASEN